MAQNKILIVDDEDKMREMLARYLGRKGFFVSEAQNGLEALERCRAMGPEVVLLDVKMPEMDGREALRRIKKDFPDTEVIMATAVAELETAISCLKEGAFGYQLKPFNLESLEVEITRALERRCLVLENRRYQKNLERLVEERTKELRIKNQELEKLDELKDKFINCVSHELRTPLTLIMGGLSVLDLTFKDKADESGKKLFNLIREGERRLALVVEQMVKSLRAEYKEELLKKERVHVNAMVKEVFLTVSPFVSLRNQKLRYELPEEDIYFEGDRGKLRDVFLNLAMNAIKFTPDGGHILIKLQRAEDSFRIAMQDDGIGLNEEDKRHIFKKFFEVEDTGRHRTGVFQFKAGGLGLGLPIAKLFTEMHGGKIKVDSEGRSKGSVFTVEFPLKRKKNNPRDAEHGKKI